MVKSSLSRMLLLVVFSLFFASFVVTSAEEPPLDPPGNPLAGQPLVRELFVPLSELSTILEADKERVFLPREQYEKMIRDARQKMGDKPPQAALLLAATYEAALETERAVIKGTLTFEVLDDGLHQLPLDVGRAGIRVASLDGKPAMLARDVSGSLFLLSDVKGVHQLELIFTTPLVTSAAQQTLPITLPQTAATKLTLSVPGNVEVKGGAPVLSRVFDEASNVTRLEVKPTAGESSVVMSLNNKQLRQQSLVIARGVLVDEVTLGYERLHATMAMRVLHGGTDRFRFELPAGFEVTKVDSAMLARWEVTPGKAPGEGAILEAIMSEAITDTVVIDIAANRSVKLADEWLAALKTWKFPQLRPLDVAGQVFVVGLLSEDRLQPYGITTTDLVPIDAAVLATAIPASVLSAEPGAPTVRQVASFYAPSSSFSLAASFDKPAAGLFSRSNVLLTISEQELSVIGGFAITPDSEKLFEVRFTAPPLWQVSEVTLADGSPLPIERYGTVDGGSRIIVRLPVATPKGEAATINYKARFTPPGWLGKWTTQKISLPQFVLEGATRDNGAVAIELLDDLQASPDKFEGLSPLLDNEKAAFGLASVATSLSYRFDARPYAMELTVSRTEPSLTADVVSFFQLEPDLVRAHYELQYSVREASTRILSFSLPVTTPAEIAVTGMYGAVAKEYRATIDGDRRVWTVELDRRYSGDVSLAVDFVKRVADKERRDLLLPLIAAEGVEYQSSLAAVEGSAELDVQVKASPRKVDVGELANAEYQVGKRIIGAYGYVGADAKLTIDMLERDAYPLPPAIVQRAQLISKVSMQGIAQSVARYAIITKADTLEISLPPSSTLWTILLDGAPTKPQRTGDSLLLSLPSQQAPTLREIRLVYETKLSSLGLTGMIDLAPPRLMLIAGESRDVPQADLDWKLTLPAGYELSSSSSQFTTTDLPKRVHPAVKVAAVLYELAGGFDPFYGSTKWRSDVGGTSYYYNEAPTTQKSAADSFRFGIPTPSAVSSAPMGAPATDPMSTVDRPMAEALEEMPAADATPPPPSMEPPAPAAPAPPVLAPAEPMVPQSAPTGEMKPSDQSQSEPPGEQRGELEERLKEQTQLARETLDARFWALEGVSSLAIDITPQENEPTVSFASLGGTQPIEVAVIDSRRMSSLAWGVSLLVLIVGLALTRQNLAQQLGYVAVLLLVSGLVPLLGETFSQVTSAMEGIFFAAVLLVPYYLLVAIAKPTYRKLVELAACCRTTNLQQIASVMVMALVLATASTLSAQEPAPTNVIDLEKLIPLLTDQGPPVTVPPDAVIVPFDPELPDGEEKATKVLIPYAKYVELWNLAHPEKKIDDGALPREFALARASYSASLVDGNELVIQGELTIDVLTNKGVAIPLALRGAMLQRALVDGKPARLSLATLAEIPQPQLQMPPEMPGSITILHLPKKGRVTVSLVIHTGLVRRGGWRAVDAILPVAAANEVQLKVPLAKTEIRLADVPDQGRWETKADAETIVTTLATSGALNLQWRPQVAEAVIDQGLTARSTGVLDVREDAVRMAWTTMLEFGRGSRDRFTFLVPLDYTIEQVQGVNIRGWEAKVDGDQQTLDVTLLRTAVGSETITVQLSRRGLPPKDELLGGSLIAAPQVQVVGAALQQGEVAVRRGNRLTLRTTQSTGLSRADLSAEAAAVAQSAEALDAPVLPLSNYQSYRYVSLPYVLRLVATEQAANVTATLQTAVRIASRDTTIDAAIQLRSVGQPLYHVDVSLPKNFRLDRLLPAGLEWSLTPADDHQRLSVQLQTGQAESFTLTLQGLLVRDSKEKTLDIPRLSVLSATSQTGEIVFLADPDTDVSLSDLKNCILASGVGWLAQEQRSLARIAINYRVGDYSGKATTRTRQPVISGRSITNVKVTRRAIEETVLVTYNVQRAGIHEISLLLPDYLRRARVRTPLLKRKFIETAKDAEGKEIPGFVRLVIELQDDVIGPLSFVLEHDRLLASTKQSVITPQLTQVQNPERLMAVENAGVDEVLIDGKSAGLEEVPRAQQLYREVSAILGDQLTQLFRVPASISRGELQFQTNSREEVERPRARIELATSVLVVDAAGTYRGQQDYRLSNDTEQFLEVKLPSGSSLWTAIVAGEPVKPVQLDPPVAGSVRIPLVKTAEGEGDYLVQLKYGGQMPPLASLSEISFPLILALNIKAEESQTTLYLPKNFVWQSFGGTMRHVDDRGELELGFQSYLNRRITSATQLLSSSNPFTKLRAQANLKMAEAMLSNGNAMNTTRSSEQGQYNYQLLSKARELSVTELNESAGAVIVDNRARLNEFNGEQQLRRSKNVVSNFGSNFDGRASGIADPNAPPLANGNFNNAWFDQNKLNSAAPNQAGDKAEQLPGKPYASGSRVQSRARFDDQRQEQSVPQLRLEEAQQKMQEAKKSKADTSEGLAYGSKDRRGLERYQKQLDDEVTRDQLQQQLGNSVPQVAQSYSGDESGGGNQGGLGAVPGGQPMPGLAGGSGPMGGFGGGENTLGRNDFYANPDRVETYNGPAVAMDVDAAAQHVELDAFGALATNSATWNVQLANGQTGYTSLDVDLTAVGDAYLFTTPRGEVSITARPVARSLVEQSFSLGIALVVILIAVAIIRFKVAQRIFAGVQSTIGCILACVFGFAMMVCGVFPVLGMLLFVTTLVLIVSRAIRTRLATWNSAPRPGL